MKKVGEFILRVVRVGSSARALSHAWTIVGIVASTDRCASAEHNRVSLPEFWLSFFGGVVWQLLVVWAALNLALCHAKGPASMFVTPPLPLGDVFAAPAGGGRCEYLPQLVKVLPPRVGLRVKKIPFMQSKPTDFFGGGQ